MCFLLTFFSACNNNDSATNLQSALNTYSVLNSHAWSGIDPDSSALAGKCAIVGNNIVYTKVDMDYSGTDECNWSGASGQYYGIDFSSPDPKLEAKLIEVE